MPTGINLNSQISGIETNFCYRLTLTSSPEVSRMLGNSSWNTGYQPLMARMTQKWALTPVLSQLKILQVRQALAWLIP